MEPQSNTEKSTAEADVKRPIGSGFGMRALALMMRLAPAVAYGFALIPVLWYYHTKPEGRRAAAVLHRLLGLAGGGFAKWRFGLRQARMFSKIILDNMYLGFFGPGRFIINEQGTDLLRAELKKGKGLILLSAHMGNWHLAVNFLSNTDTHVHLVMDDVRQEEVRRQMDLAKSMSAHLTVHGAEAGPGLAFALSAALRKGEVVIIAGDRTGKGGRKTKAVFLGVEAWFPTAALALAAAADAPVCAALTFREGTRRYTCYGVGPLAFPEDAPKPNRIDAMLQDFVLSLETFVRRYPDQWFNFYDFWAD